MNDIRSRLTDYGSSLVASLAERVRTERVTQFGPVNATGNLAASLRFEVEETATGYRLNLYAASYALSLEYGRRPGKFPPLKSIQLWIEARGFTQQPGGASVTAGKNGYSSLAYLIGRKIANEGSFLYKQNLSLFSKALAPDITAQKLAEYLVPAIHNEIINSILSAVSQ